MYYFGVNTPFFYYINRVSTPGRTYHTHPIRHHPYSVTPPLPFSDYSLRHQAGPRNESEEFMRSIIQGQNELKEMVKSLSDRVGRLEDKCEESSLTSPPQKLPPELSVCML